MKISAEVFLFGGQSGGRSIEGFHCVIGAIDKSDIKSLGEYTDTIRELLDIYGFNADWNQSWEFYNSSTKLQKFRMPSQAVIKKHYEAFLINQKSLV